MTVRDIQYDLRSIIRGAGIFLLLCIVLFMLNLAFVIAMFSESVSLFAKMCVALLPLPFLVGMIACVAHLYRCVSSYKNPYIIVGQLVDMKIRGHLQHKFRGYYETYHLLFYRYGKYHVSGSRYEWSELYSMADNMVYRYSECDDEFYLVLSRTHTEKILMVYNTKMFHLQE